MKEGKQLSSHSLGRLTRIVSAAALTLALAGSAAVAVGASNPLTFAGVGKSAVWYWFDVQKGMQISGKAVGSKIVFQNPTTADPAQQVNEFNGFIAQHVNGIAYAASDPAAMRNVTLKALKAGIPVVMFDSDAPNSGRLMYVGANAVEGGLLAGREMVALLHGHGTVAIQVGSLTALNAKQRIQGFMQGIKGSQIKVITTQNDNEDPATATTQAREVLAAHPDLSAFFGVYAYDAAAEATAVQAAHRAGKTLIVGWDNQPGMSQLIQNGVVQATVFDNEQMYGQVATIILYDMHTFGVGPTLAMFGFKASGDRANNVVYTPVVMVTKANLHSVPGF